MIDLFIHVRDHLALAAAALAVALVIGVPVGSAVARAPRLRAVSLGAIYVARVIPLDEPAADEALPGISGLRPDILADEEATASNAREKFARDHGIIYAGS